MNGEAMQLSGHFGMCGGASQGVRPEDCPRCRERFVEVRDRQLGATPFCWCDAPCGENPCPTRLRWLEVDASEWDE